MTRSNSKQNNNTAPPDFFKNPWTKITGTIIAIAAIFGFGYKIGQFKEQLDWQIQKLELEQKCDERLQIEINNCRETKLTEYGKSVEDIKNLVKELKGKKQ